MCEYCTFIFSDPSQLWKLVDGILINKAGIWFSNIKWRIKRRGSRIYIENKSTLDVLGLSRFDVIQEECFRENPFQLWKTGKPNFEGYFTLQNAGCSNFQLLTAISSSNLQIQGIQNSIRL